MSVFSDFQRMWVEKFPDSSLSDAWEQDVRESLARHRQRIVELQKELEQETLYVEYLERLLSDVEKFRESGGDPHTLIEASTPTAAAAAALSFPQVNHPAPVEAEDVSSTTTTTTATAQPQTPVAVGTSSAVVDTDDKEDKMEQNVSLFFSVCCPCLKQAMEYTHSYLLDFKWANRVHNVRYYGTSFLAVHRSVVRSAG